MSLGVRTWRLQTHSRSAASALSQELGITPLAARILSSRGFSDPAEVKDHLNPQLAWLPKPTAMAGLPEAVERLAHAVEGKERIAVFGDYDADGITSAALAVDFLRRLGADVRPWLANRFTWGYGLAKEAVAEMVADRRSLALVLDCGTSDYEALAAASKSGLDVVVVDHHQPGPELPETKAMVNPHRADCGFEDKGMASVGLAFYLMGALRTKLRSSADVRPLLDLVAIGTVADVSPMDGINRILVSKGLETLGSRPHPGLAALQAVTGVTGPPTSETVAFKLGPRINAAGRLGSPEVALELLLTQSSTEARQLAGQLNDLSLRRREIQEELVAAAMPEARQQAEAGAPIILVGGEGWHQGVIGIVAARLCDEFFVPAGVVGFEDGLGRGSLRAPAGYNLHKALRECREHLDRFGGHAAAAGFSVNADEMDAFVAAMCRVVGAQAEAREVSDMLRVDAEADPGDFSMRVVADLERLGPFGNGNPEPVVTFPGAQVVRADRRNGGHMSVRFDCGGVKVRAFGPVMADAWPRGAKELDLAFSLRRNSYRGVDSAELRLIDVQPTESRS